jgi:hypothetical protein
VRFTASDRPEQRMFYEMIRAGSDHGTRCCTLCYFESKCGTVGRSTCSGVLALHNGDYRVRGKNQSLWRGRCGQDKDCQFQCLKARMALAYLVLRDTSRTTTGAQSTVSLSESLTILSWFKVRGDAFCEVLADTFIIDRGRSRRILGSQHSLKYVFFACYSVSANQLEWNRFSLRRMCRVPKLVRY